MIVKDTNKYIVIDEIPGYTLHQHVYSTDVKCEDFPRIFTKLYQFETGDYVFKGKSVYRLVSKNGITFEIKQVNFSTEHITKNIFPNLELAQKKLVEINITLSAIKEKADITSYLKKINNYCLKDINNRTIGEIQEIFNTIKEYSSQCLNYLKNENK